MFGSFLGLLVAAQLAIMPGSFPLNVRVVNSQTLYMGSQVHRILLEAPPIPANEHWVITRIAVATNGIIASDGTPESIGVGYSVIHNGLPLQSVSDATAIGVIGQQPSVATDTTPPPPGQDLQYIYAPVGPLDYWPGDRLFVQVLFASAPAWAFNAFAPNTMATFAGTRYTK